MLDRPLAQIFSRWLKDEETFSQVEKVFLCADITVSDISGLAPVWIGRLVDFTSCIGSNFGSPPIYDLNFRVEPFWSAPDVPICSLMSVAWRDCLERSSLVRQLYVFVATVMLIASVSYAATTSMPVSSAGAAASPADPNFVLGNEACVKCHASEIQTWQATPHAKTFDELHRSPEAKQIASKLGLQSIKHEGRCINCHYTTQTEAATGKHALIAGVSCESCHGAAKNWLEAHHDYGGEGITRLTESPEHRVQRIAKSVAAGMRNPTNVFLVAQSCLRCHTTADEQLVNLGGHSAGSLDFEFVSWSQGTIRHNFVRSDGKSNDVSSPERLRVMFVAGMVAELESSMRATAVATEKATYGVTVANRAARAGARLKSVAAKITDPRLTEMIAIFDSVTLKLNNAAELSAAADKIAGLGYQFAEQADGSQFAVLDSFVPPSDRWK